MAQQTEVPTKKWYKSKIVLLALTILGVTGSNLLFGFLSGNVTPEQINAINDAYPQAVEIIHRVQNGETIFAVFGTVVSLVIIIARVWFTNKLIPQSLSNTTK